ncbi:PAS domain S-box protein [Candidatus Gracilibacteria bacterium]|nr:PAS domain S-box protein [Candidatus Gracilibacteria bacterium]
MPAACTSVYDESSSAAQLLARIAELEAQLATSEAARQELTTALRTIERVRTESAETAIRASEERLRMVLSNMPVMLNAWDEGLQITVWNAECERVTGYSAAEMIGRSDMVARLYPDETYRTELIDEWRRIGGNFRNLEMTLTRKDGSQRTVAWSNLSSIFPIPGWVSWAIGVDVTGRLQAEAALRESEELYRTLFEASRDAIVITDDQGQYLDVNQAAADLFGLSREQLLGLRATDVVMLARPGAFERPHDMRTDGTAIGELAFIRPDGEPRIAQYSASRISVDLNQRILRDVTAERQAQQALRESDERLRLALAAAAMVAWEWDLVADSVIWVGDPYRVLDLARRDDPASDSLMLQMMPEDDRRIWRHALNTSSANDDVRIEHRYYRADGSLGWVEAYARRTSQIGGVTSRLVGVTRDITQRKDLEAALRHREQQFSMLVENVPDVIFRYRIEPHASYEYVSPAIEAITGYPPDALYADPAFLTAITYHADRPIMERINTQMDNGVRVPTPFTIRIRHRDGSLRWLELISTPIFKADSIVAYDGVVHDITAHKQLEQTLRIQTRFQEALAGSLRALHSHGHDRIARERIFSAMAAQLCYGVEASHVQIWQLYEADQLHLVAAANADGALATGDAVVVLSGLAPMLQAQISAETAILTPVVIEAFVQDATRPSHYYVFPVSWPQTRWGVLTIGVAPGMLLSKQDCNLAATVVEMLRTTIRRWNAVDALVDNERTLRLALNAGQLGLWDYELASQQVTLSASFAQLFALGMNDTTIPLEDILMRLHPEDREGALAHLADAVAGSEPTIVEVRYVQHDGTVLWIRTQGQVVFDALQRPARIVGVLNNISEERRAQAIIAEANAELERRVALRTLELEEVNAELHESRRFIERVLTASPVQVYVFDYRRKRLIYTNRPLGAFLDIDPNATTDDVTYPFRQIFTPEPDDYPIEILMHPDDAARLPTIYDVYSSMGDDTVVENEFRVREPSGAWRWFSSRDLVFSRGSMVARSRSSASRSTFQRVKPPKSGGRRPLATLSRYIASYATTASCCKRSSTASTTGWPGSMATAHCC